MEDPNQDTTAKTWTLKRTDNDGHQHMLSLSDDDVAELVKLWIDEMIDITSGIKWPSVVIIRTSQGGVKRRLTLTNDEMTEIVRLWAEQL